MKWRVTGVSFDPPRTHAPQEADINRDGVLSQREFRRMMEANRQYSKFVCAV